MRSVRIKQLQEFLKSDHWLRRYCIIVWWGILFWDTSVINNVGIISFNAAYPLKWHCKLDSTVTCKYKMCLSWRQFADRSRLCASLQCLASFSVWEIDYGFAVTAFPARRALDVSHIQGFQDEIAKDSNIRENIGTRIETILPSVLKFQVDCTWLHGGEGRASFVGKWNTYTCKKEKECYV